MGVLDTFSLRGKVALVTGGGGLYGRQIVQALAEAGARTFMASRDPVRLESQARVFRDAGLDVTALFLDQSKVDSVRDLLAKLIRRVGAVDVLINNAVERPMKDWDGAEVYEQFAQSMAINATGLFVMMREFGNHMAQHGRGSIINVGSIQGCVGPDFSLYAGLDWGAPPDYFFHKGGLLQLMRYAAAKLGPRGVRVNAISPGGFLSDQDVAFVQRYNSRTFLGRMANDSDLKGAIVFLASDASLYITGANLIIDGGYTAK